MMREPPFQPLPTPRPTPLVGRRLLVLGLGDTGISVARWAAREGASVRVADSRRDPPRRADFAGELHAGPFSPSLLQDVDVVCISPGLSLEEPLIRAAAAQRLPVFGDIELFAWHARQPVLAVTGTNGKSTVTALAGHLVRSAGVDCEVAGNIGPPVLEAFRKRLESGKLPRAWVLELSSYQLETTWSLAPAAAAMLNLTEDHLDRYASLEDYGAAKARVFMGAAVQVLNRDDPRSLAMAQPGKKLITFGLDKPSGPREFGLAGDRLVQGSTEILPVDELPIRGMHNVANALAACALVSTINLDAASLARGLKTFKGLPHRLELVATRRGVEWYDDSKGTNVGATAAALRGLGRKSVLILGGDGKGQDFSPLREVARKFASHVLLIGRDAPLIGKVVPGERCASLEQAVQRAAGLARPGEAVLLSPACASFDMFRDYRHRGEVFAQAVRSLGP
ncbi:MAG TPA: UDP-N-acetylmuramoyl-L-alanine--D-glutamate ligase [Burkholderiales bacterium]|nr:UDP-N-acetylmuramoyl-L-alanine--D-glutamate ligase [Burkholderiales bacterium]